MANIYRRISRSYRREQEIQLSWLLRLQKNSADPDYLYRKQSAISLSYRLRTTSENLEAGFPSHKIGLLSEWVCLYTCLVPAVAEKLRIKRLPFSELQQEIGYSVPLHLLLPWMIKQGSLY